MFDLIIHRISEATDESAEETFTRLNRSANEAGCETDTLFEVEEDAIRIAEKAVEESDEDPSAFAADAIDNLATQFGFPVDGASAVEAAGGTETVISLLGQGATARPRATAGLVKLIFDCYRSNGLYRELGIDPERNWAESDAVAKLSQHVGEEETDGN